MNSDKLIGSIKYHLNIQIELGREVGLSSCRDRSVDSTLTAIDIATFSNLGS